MTRAVLSTLLSLLVLALGLVTAFVQCENHAQAFELDEILSECRMVEAVNDAHRVDVLALDWGPDAGRQPDAYEGGDDHGPEGMQ